MEIANILATMRKTGYFHSVDRCPVKIEINKGLAILESIGKEMTPNFVIDDSNKFVYKNMIRWMAGDPQMKAIDPTTKEVIPGNLRAGIYIAGPTGTGKTFTMDLFAIFGRILRIPVGFNGNPDRRVLSWGSFRTDDICEEFNQQGTFDRFRKIPIVCLQDLGSEPAESMYMGNRVPVMRQILENRGDRQDQITLITSNLPIIHDQTAEKYGDRVVSRLCSLTNYFELKGGDRRK